MTKYEKYRVTVTGKGKMIQVAAMATKFLVSFVGEDE